MRQILSLFVYCIENTCFVCQLDFLMLLLPVYDNGLVYIIRDFSIKEGRSANELDD